MSASNGWYEIHTEEHSRNRDQLDLASELLAQDSGIVVQPRPSVLDVELERSIDDQTVVKGSGSASELDLGEEWKFPVGTDGERLLGEDDDDDELQQLDASGLAQKHWRISRVTLILRGPKWKMTSTVFVVSPPAYTSPCSTAKTSVVSP